MKKQIIKKQIMKLPKKIQKMISDRLEYLHRRNRRYFTRIRNNLLRDKKVSSLIRQHKKFSYSKVLVPIIQKYFSHDYFCPLTATVFFNLIKIFPQEMKPLIDLVKLDGYYKSQPPSDI